MAHIHGFPDNELEWYEMLLNCGAGDPDVYGYPGEEES